MESNELIGLFGARADSAQVEAFFKRAGVAKRPKLPKGEYNAYLEFEKKGVALLFQDEAMLKDEDKPVGTGPLIFAGAFFYSEGHEDYSQYQGELPEGLEFSDSRDTVVEKLGPSDWQDDDDGDIYRERWDRPDYKLLLDYAAGGASILVVYCGIA
jgi:hypothetical protein